MGAIFELLTSSFFLKLHKHHFDIFDNIPNKISIIFEASIEIQLIL